MTSESDPPPAPDQEAPATPKGRVLLLENRLDVAAPWRKILILAGYDCEIAESKADARELLADEASTFDLMLADLGLTRAEDVKLVQDIRDMERYAHLPIMIMTGLKAPEARKQALALGVVEYLIKPVDAGIVLPLIARWIQPK